MKEIEQEAYGEHGMATQDPKQTAAVDLSNRLKDLRAGNDGSSQKGFLSPIAQSFTSDLGAIIIGSIYLFSVICVIGFDKDDALMRINHR